MLTFPISAFNSQQFFIFILCGANHDQHTLLVIHPDIAVNTISPDIDIAFP